VPLGQAGSWSMGRHQQRVIPDDSGGHPATASGGVSWVPGLDGQTPVMHLDGSTGFAQTSAAVLDTRGSYSVEAWVQLDRLPTLFATAVSQDSDRASAFYLQYSGIDRGFAMSAIDPQGTRRALSKEEPKPGVWYHMAGVRDADSGTRSLYVDGVLQAEIAASGVGTMPGRLQIGRARFDCEPRDYFPGSIARVTVYQRALRGTEVLALFRAGAVEQPGHRGAGGPRVSPSAQATSGR
jgi:Concanavalin A-like lectin/glucanases superfamily